jgi:hypothetical protein
MRSRDALAIAMFGMMLIPGGLVARGASAQSSETPGSAAGVRAITGGGDLQTIAPPRGRSLEEERDAGRGPRPHEPAFLEPAATTTEHARLGLSAWITPGPPFDHREDPGGVAIGFTIGWPPPARHLPSSGPTPWRGSAER